MRKRFTIQGLTTAIAVAAFCALWPQAATAYDGYAYRCCPGLCWCGWCYSSPVISSLDQPLRCFFVPRRPGCPESDYCYRVAGPRPCPSMCPADEDGELLPSPDPCDRETAGAIASCGFERLGQIPGESFLEAGPVPGR